MAKNIKKVAVITSGGDAPGMNAAVRAVVRTCAYYELECVGFYRGYQGMIDNSFIELGPRSVHNIVNKGGTFLKTARCKEFRTPEGRAKAFANLQATGADALVVIGGNGSFMGGKLLGEEHGVQVIGIPATIDNDIFGTNYTLGYDTALNTVVDAIDKIRDTAHSHDRLFFIEVMGRDVGHIALNAGLGGGAQEILIPEEENGLERLIDSLNRSEASGKRSCIVVVAEGDKTGHNVFGLKDYVNEHLPHYDVRVSVLGHMQRGGAPSCFDRVLASRMGVKAVEEIQKGKTGYMVGIENNKMTLTPIEEAISGITKINPELMRVSDIVTV